MVMRVVGKGVCSTSLVSTHQAPFVQGTGESVPDLRGSDQGSSRRCHDLSASLWSSCAGDPDPNFLCEWHPGGRGLRRYSGTGCHHRGGAPVTALVAF